MCLKPKPLAPVPEDTRLLVERLYAPTHPCRLVGERLCEFVSDNDFADLYPSEGQPALSPALLALVTLLQFQQNLSDRRAAAMVVSRIDWKFILHLPLSYAGFDHSTLCEFRSRLLSHQAQARVF